ncbi:MAG: hypothetical protein N3E50_03565 [Candidatus Goldbacteria bacterium]|nr:hypothetical protein [Candidatus Goldiibacteriota bacterium]
MKDILKAVQDTHNKIKVIDCKLEITHDISSATITAIALLPFYDTNL